MTRLVVSALLLALLLGLGSQTSMVYAGSQPLTSLGEDTTVDHASDSTRLDDCDRVRRLPPNAIGAQANAFFAAVCTSDPAVHRAFVATAISPELKAKVSENQLVAMLERLHNDLGDAEILEVELRSPYQGSFVARHPDGGGPPLRLTLTLDEAEPHSILGFDVAPAGQSDGRQFGSLDEVKAFLKQAEADEAFSGVVLVARHGEVIFSEAYGWANKAEGERNTLDTRFNIGSLNKLITGVAVLKLAEMGKLDLDAPIGTYLDGFPDEVADRVTVRHLLQHRSGWGHYWEHPEYLARRTELRELDDYLAFIRDIPLEFEPGAQWQYSNVGYEVLGGIIEVVSGQSYYDFVREHVYAPAGMENTDSYWRDAPNLAVPYTQQHRPGYAEPLPDGLGPRGTPAGGGYATAEDLLRFEQALLDHRLLSPAMTRLFMAAYDPDRQPDTGFGRAGGAPGLNSTWESDFASGHTVL
ncbi:MAG: beta-lactamase family protein, partial [Rhodothermaceae bacterium]|nr:beta-lactamase family protein [Rhodothermaceae bacterium]